MSADSTCCILAAEILLACRSSVTYKDDSLKALKWKGNAPGLALEVGLVNLRVLSRG